MDNYYASILVKDKEGVLSRVASLCNGRGYYVTNLSFSKTVNPEIARITINFQATQSESQISNQINKLVDVKEIELLKKA